MPDIFVVGFQETVPMTFFSVLRGSKDEQNGALRECFQIALNAQADEKGSDSYTCFTQKAMVGCLILAFCKESIKHKIKRIETSRVKCGLGGKAGNKGGTIIRFDLDDTSIIFANTHLESGQKKVGARIEQFHEIQRQSFVDKNKSHKFPYEGHDLRFFFGDMNFRIDLTYENAINYSERFEHKEQVLLKQRDQLNQLLADGNELGDFVEQFIDFRPTYKYDRRSTRYDTSKKQRQPSWCDRILFAQNDVQIHPHKYERIESIFSDHRPVRASFFINTYQVNKKLLKERRNQLIEMGRQKAAET